VAGGGGGFDEKSPIFKINLGAGFLGISLSILIKTV
jgi:hypothetical protein